ncbi:helix-turn-helix domain-containing protein [Rubricoccus marinus]|nr:helix-turn-helix transcriptional regulator [Rubricoccus marinus]
MPNMSRFRLPQGPQPMDVIGPVVRARRKELGISQATLAERAAIDRTYVSSIERGQRNPTLPVLILLTVGLQLPQGALLAAVIDAIANQDDWLARAIERGSVVE